MTSSNTSVISLLKRIYFKFYWLRRGVDHLCLTVSNKKSDIQKYRLGICAIIKNEGEYIEEWIKYHLFIGADIIYLYDNDSSDNTYQKLIPYINMGKVKYSQISGHGRQLDAYNNCIRKYRYECKYIGFIDADEFLFKFDYNSDLFSIIDEVFSLDQKAGGIAVNWRIFGSSGLLKKPEGGY